MEKQQSIISKQQVTSTKNSCNNNSKKFKKKTKPIKVVYISNPMKVKTSVSEFRALVQQLTGRDSELGSTDDDDVDDDNNLFSMGQCHSRFLSAIVPNPPPPPPPPPHHHHTTMKQEVPLLVAAAKDDDVVVGRVGRRVQEVPAVVAGPLLNDTYRFPSPPVPSSSSILSSASALMNGDDDYEYEQQYYYFDQDGFVPQMMVDNHFNEFLPSSTTSCDLFLLHEQVVLAPAPAL